MEEKIKEILINNLCYCYCDNCEYGNWDKWEITCNTKTDGLKEDK